MIYIFLLAPFRFRFILKINRAHFPVISLPIPYRIYRASHLIEPPGGSLQSSLRTVTETKGGFSLLA